MRVTVLLLLCVPLLAGCGSKQELPILPGGMANRYHLTTEDTFSRAFEEKIRPYFERGEDKSFTSAHGNVHINARAFAPENPAAGKGAIVISSGRTEGMIIYQELIYDLQKQGYYVYILDHRGQGFSGRMIEKDPQRGYVENFDYYVDDLKRFVDTKVKTHQPPHPKTFLLAHSMGGAIASLYIERYQGDFDAAALVTPMHEPILVSQAMTGVVGFFNGLLPRWAATGYGLREGGYNPKPFPENELTSSKVRYEQNLDIYEHNQGAKVGGVTHGWIHEAYEAGKAAREGAKEIRIPVLLLQGGADTIVSKTAQVAFWKAANTNGCSKAYVVEKASHAIFNEADTFRIPALTTVLDFFENPPGAQACSAWHPAA